MYNRQAYTVFQATKLGPKNVLEIQTLQTAPRSVFTESDFLIISNAVESAFPDLKKQLLKHQGNDQEQPHGGTRISTFHKLPASTVCRWLDSYTDLQREGRL